jgi:hypothetical protein
MSVEDKLDIQEMIARYSLTWDSKDTDAFSQLFVAGGVFEFFNPGEVDPIVRLSSRAAILEWARQRHEEARANRSQSRHNCTGVLIESLTPETATTRSMFLVTRQTGFEDTPVPGLTGLYRDEWKKTPEGWRFARRTARSDRKGNFAKHWA